MRCILFILLVLTINTVYAQPDTLWTSYYNDDENGYREECFRLIQTQDGGFLIGGKTFSPAEDLPDQWFMDYYLVKTDSNGIEEWTGQYCITPRHDKLGGIVQKPNGDIYIAGTSDNEHITNIMKASQDGDSLSSYSYGEGDFHGAILANDGDVIAIGYTLEFSEFGGSDCYIVKIDEDGEVIWRGVYGGGGHDMLFDIAAVDSGYVAVGFMGGVSDVLKIDENGEQVWFRQYDFTDDLDRFYCVTALPDGGILAGGTVGFDEALLVKFDSDGDTVWVRREIPGFRERIWDIAPAHGDGYIIVGGDGIMNNGYDIMRVDDLGEEVWEIEIEFDGDASFDEATSVLALDDGGYLIGGNRWMRFLGGYSAGLIRTAPDPANAVWEIDPSLPSVFQLHPAYPNPFNAITNISYNLTCNNCVEIVVIDLKGNRIRTLVNAPQKAGRHTAIWDGRNEAGIPVPSGLYFYRINAGNFTKVKKMTLVK